MRHLRPIIIAAACTAGAAALASTPGAVGPTYGDTLLRAAMARHPGVSAITVQATGKAGPVTAAAGTPDPKHGTTLPLTDSMGQPIGTVTVSARRAGAASAVAADLGRRIYTPDNLSDADPFVAGAVRAPRAQAIVERMIDTHPRLVTLAMHVAPPGGENIILASNFGRIGKAADKDDAHVIADGAVLKEVTNGGKRLAVELPQKDSAGRVIGALSTSFTITPDHDADQAYADALALRDEIARATPSLAALTAKR